MYSSKRLKTAKRPIYLVGFMASGKTTLARELARSLGLEYLDLDLKIEQELSMPILKLFKQYGEEYFRYVEACALRMSSADVISCGGGAPMFYDGMSYMNRAGVTIFIDTPWDVIESRLKSDRKRPLASGQNLKELYHTRLNTYQQAQCRLNTTGNLSEDVVNLVELIERA